MVRNLQARSSCSLNPEQLPWYRDKSATQGFSEELGLPSPGFAKIPTSGLTPELIAHTHFPLVTKPLDKYGSRNVYVVHNLEELKQAITETCFTAQIFHQFVEEYAKGVYEFNMMTWVHKGKVHVISIADREKRRTSDREIDQHPKCLSITALYEQVVTPATDLLQCYADKTGQKEGRYPCSFSTRLGKRHPDLMIAARFFGYEHELTDMVYGFSIEDLLLNYLCSMFCWNRCWISTIPWLPICRSCPVFRDASLQIRDPRSAKLILILQ